MVRLVTHADYLLGNRVATQFLRSGEHVRAHVSAPYAAHKQLRKAGADVVGYDLYAQDGFDGLEWRDLSSIFHASVSGAARSREAVLSLSDLGAEKLVQQAEKAGVQRFVLLHPPTLEIQVRLANGPLLYTLLCPEAPEREVILSGSVRGRVLERRRLVVFIPLLRVVEVVVFASSGNFGGFTFRLPTLTRRYSDVIDEIERLLRLRETPVADLLLAELVMGSPYKLITPGVARALGLAFPKGYVRQVFSTPEH